MSPAAAIAVWLAAVLPAPGKPVDFDTQVMPLLTRAGCNAGACHGAAAGRGGFRLSLLGSDPARDHETIVRELEGRRVDLTRPDESLVLTKPSGQLDHEGGVRLKPGGRGFDRLRDWLRQGATRLGSRRLVEFAIEPSSAIVESSGTRVPFRAEARFSDGTREDVSQDTVFSAVDPGAVVIVANAVGVAARIERPGRHVVLARFLERVVAVNVTLPLGDQPIDLASEPRNNFIDDEILSTLETLRVPPAPFVDDAGFLRRVHLDLTGRLPTPEEIKAFQDDRAPAHRARRIDRLLASDAFAEYWACRLGELLRIGAIGQNLEGAQALRDWLADRIATGASVPEMARTLLTATGDPSQFGPAHFFKVVGDARAQAEYVGQVFLGARIQCANCHNHPLDRWTQDDYHGLAALFARVERGADGLVRLARMGEVTHPATGLPARPRIPGARDLDARDPDDGRAALADWLAARENPRLARAMVNRLWRALMGRGLVEPADDLRETNPATHPALLDRLAEDFLAQGADIRRTLRRIATSACYARAGASNALQRADDRFYSRALVRPLPVEVLSDALSDVTGVPESFADKPEGTRAVALVGPLTASPTLDVLGRCSREAGCESARGTGGGLASALHRLNGPVVNRRLADPSGRLSASLAAGRSIDEVLNDFYLRALCRPPGDAERGFWRRAFIEVGESAEARRAVLEDAAWSLLNSTEFLTNH